MPSQKKKKRQSKQRVDRNKRAWKDWVSVGVVTQRNLRHAHNKHREKKHYKEEPTCCYDQVSIRAAITLLVRTGGVCKGGASRNQAAKYGCTECRKSIPLALCVCVRETDRRAIATHRWSVRVLLVAQVSHESNCLLVVALLCVVRRRIALRLS